jgi:hypothetical protein
VEFVSYYTVFDEDRQVATARVTALFPDMPDDSQQALIDWLCSLGLLRADAGRRPAGGHSWRRSSSDGLG